MTSLPAANSFEYGSNGVTISPANSGGGSGSAFDLVTIGANAALAYDNAHAAHGSLAGKYSTGASSVTCLTQWSALGSVLEHWGRVYMYWTAAPAVIVRPIEFDSSAGALQCRLHMLTSGKLQLGDANNVALGVFTNATPLNQWVRFEWHVVHDAINGTFEGKLFSADASVPIETLTATVANTGAAGADRMLAGITLAKVNVGPFWMDDFNINGAAYPGPVQAFAPTISDGLGAGDALSRPAAYVRSQGELAGGTDSLTALLRGLTITEYGQAGASASSGSSVVTGGLASGASGPE